jgi:hypothetical protein
MELDLFSTYKVTAEWTQETSFIVSYSTETRGLSLIAFSRGIQVVDPKRPIRYRQ